MEPIIVKLTAPSGAAHNILPLVAFAVVGVTIVVHIMVALGVMKDARLSGKGRG